MSSILYGSFSKKVSKKFDMADSNSKNKNRVLHIYNTLLDYYGPQNWWPSKSPFETCVGAILTQNTAWRNVEKAIANLEQAQMLTIEAIADSSHDKLAKLIRPSGYFNQKAKRLSDFCNYLLEQYDGRLGRLFELEIEPLRHVLLQQKGIGPETADSMICYAAGKPIFVVDAYTKRIFSRKNLIAENADYDTVQKLFMDHLPVDGALYNEYHALIVQLGAAICKKSSPLCEQCPIRDSQPADAKSDCC